MRALGKQFSNWWLLLLLLILILGAPVLLMGFFMANNFIGSIVGPPARWNRPWNPPPREDIVGNYVETKRTWDQPSNSSKATLELRSDGSMYVNSLPIDEVTSNCILSGTGRWGKPDEDGQVGLTLNSATGTCKAGSYSFLQLVGHSKPYGFYWVLGDPDSGTGIWLKKE